LDCLGPSPFPFENPRFEALDFLGFPWILSSKTRLINGLHGIFSEKFFARPGSREKKPERAPAVDAIRKGGVVHGATLLQFLIFCNQLPESFAEVGGF
jgi:hypothetical protein